MEFLCLWALKEVEKRISITMVELSTQPQIITFINLFVCSLFCLLFVLFYAFLSDSSNASISTRPVINFVNMGANSVENRNGMVYSLILIFNSNFNFKIYKFEKMCCKH